MKQHRSANSLMTAALAVSVLLSGALSTGNAEERKGQHHTVVRAAEHGRRSDHHHNHTVPQRSQVHQRKVVVHKRVPHIVRALPRGFRTVRTPGHHHYVHNGVYYVRRPHGFEVVGVPRFVVLPLHARRVIVDGSVYYLCDDTWYCRRDGLYEVCDAPHRHGSITFGAGPFRIVLSDH